ncbi:MAG: pyruvate, phosphate dikinase [Deltaproteobacteria bacterium]|nr:pyruvate, phosphate dikinase [Deltaproteobacteria bacterium]
MKYIYFFSQNETDGKASMRDLLGGKGAGLAEMSRLGIRVPPGFTITTEVCRYFQQKKKLPPGLEEEIKKYMSKVENITNMRFGDESRPLLVSVRSGAAVSMPGMMDTVLNLGLNDITVKGLAKKTGDERFAYDAYRRFISMFGNIVLGIPYNKFEELLEKRKEEENVKEDPELSAKGLKRLCEDYKELLTEEGFELPQDPWKQLIMAIKAVFSSWNNPRAIKYREINHISHDMGTAVTVQAMVFGNMGENSGTGVAFTRNPSTGEKQFFGECLINAQGEDVVAGIRTPIPVQALKERIPQAYDELVAVYQKLENHFRDAQDLEFTVQEGKLYLLQTRTAKRTALAAVKIAVDMVEEGLITKEEAVMRIEPEQIDQLLHPMIDPNEKTEPIARGLPASPGAAVGRVVFSAKDAEEWTGKGEPVVLVRTETSPEDVGGMHVAEGILTSRGGMTSHAAVVGRGMGKCCVVGCSDITVYEDEKKFVVKGKEVREGDWITIDGTTGEVILGKVKLVEAKLTPQFETLLKWADEVRKLGVRANADTPEDARVARDLGAEGIGLCRTEHMFFGKNRISIMQEMIMAETLEERRKSLSKLLPFQKEDFKGIFRVMDGLPVIIRLLDPPLHEFLPKYEMLLEEYTRLKFTNGSKKRLKELEDLLAKVEALREFNPMLGHRGCRLSITFPEITEMQTRAIMEAAAEVIEEGKTVLPEIMIPLVSHVNEVKTIKEGIIKTAEQVMKEKNVEIPYKIGTMIELPRAVVTADRIAKEVEFFSFGTNDLTQAVFGFSRDDAVKFLNAYEEKGILPQDPFASIDIDGVGEMVRMGRQKGKSSNPQLEIGVCGEHGGEPRSIDFFNSIGLDYVSCSPYRVPVARLSAAQAEIRKRLNVQ